MKKIISLLVFIIILQSCQNAQPAQSKNNRKRIQDSVFVLTDPNVNSEAPYIFNNGVKIILNWTQRAEHDKKDNILKFAVFNSDTGKFDSIITVTSSKGLQDHLETMAKVGIKKDGNIFAVYRKKLPTDRSRFGGLLYDVTSKDQGKTWSKEQRLVKDTTSTSQSFYDIALLPNGNMGLTWLDSRSKRRGKTLYFAQTDANNVFSLQKPVAFSTCECCRTDLYMDSRGQIHIAYRNLIEPDEPGFDGHGFTEIRDMYYLKSVDTAKTFTQPIPISRDNWHVNGCPHTGPSLAFNGQKLGAIWFTGAHQQSGLYFTTKTDNKAFLPRKTISKEGQHPQMIAMKGKFYAVYESYYEKAGKGYYKIILDIIQPDGQHQPHEISKPLTQNNHPVLTQMSKDKILAAWTNTDTRHPKIVYKIIKID